MPPRPRSCSDLVASQPSTDSQIPLAHSPDRCIPRSVVDCVVGPGIGRMRMRTVKSSLHNSLCESVEVNSLEAMAGNRWANSSEVGSRSEQRSCQAFRLHQFDQYVGGPSQFRPLGKIVLEEPVITGFPTTLLIHLDKFRQEPDTQRMARTAARIDRADDRPPFARLPPVAPPWRPAATSRPG